MRPSSTPETNTYGLACWSGKPRNMRAAHRHDDIELNYVESGSLTYLFGGSIANLASRSVTAFWASMPHQLVESSVDTSLYWITIPLQQFLGWSLSSSLVSLVLRGNPVSLPIDAIARHGSSYFDQWAEDFRTPDAERHSVAALEIEGYFRRIALARAAFAEHDDVDAARGGGASSANRHAASMARFIVLHAHEELSAAAIANAVHLHPHYAMSVFRQVVGVTLGEYVTFARLAAAQRLLLTTDLTVATIARTAGFGSLSQFYACFRKDCGVSPSEYRRTRRASVT